MTPSQIINDAMAAGVILATNGETITYKSKDRPAPELIETLRQHKAALIKELKHKQQLWLYGLALSLNSTPQALIANDVISVANVRQYWHTDPHEVAKLIHWKPTPETTRPTTCGECVYFQRIQHPHLGRCINGEPMPAAGLWDNDNRYCEVASFE